MKKSLPTPTNTPMLKKSMENSFVLPKKKFMNSKPILKSPKLVFCSSDGVETMVPPSPEVS